MPTLQDRGYNVIVRKTDALRTYDETECGTTGLDFPTRIGVPTVMINYFEAQFEYCRDECAATLLE